MTRLRWAGVLCTALALAAAAALAARSLRIETHLVDVLPQGTPAAEDYRVFLEHFGAIERVFVVVAARGEVPAEGEREAVQRVAETIAAELAASPLVASAQAGLSAADERFFLEHVLPRGPLLAADEAAVAERLEPAAVRDRIRVLRQRLRTPSGASAARLLAADPLDFAELLTAPSGGVAAPVDPATGAFVSADGRSALVVVNPVAAELDSEAGRELAAALEAATAEARAAEPMPLSVHAVGGPLYAAQDEAILRADLVRTIGGSALAITAVLLLAFRAPGVPLALVATVAVGLAWTAGLAAWIFRPEGSEAAVLSALAIGFGSILLGLGVDYGIHLAARQRAERLRGSEPGRAVLAAGREIAPAITASAITTGGAFLVLGLASFRPVRELGLLVGLGVVLLLPATAAVAAPLLALLGRRRLPPARAGRGWRWIESGVHRAVAGAVARPRTVLAVAAALTLAAAIALPRLAFDADLRSLRPTDHPSRAAEAKLAAAFGLGLDTATVVVEGDDAADALDRAAAVARAIRDGLAADGGAVSAAVSTPSDWLPGREVLGERLERRQALAAGAVAAMRDELSRQGLAERAFAEVLAVLDDLAAGRSPPAVPLDAWPAWLDAEVVRGGAASGEAAALVAVRLTATAGEWSDGPPAAVLAAIERSAPGAPFASFQRLAAELRRLLGSDLRRLGGVALAVVALLVLASFRGRPVPAVLSLVPVSLGLVWTLGLCAALGVALDPFSLVVAPVLVGIGIDDGLHALHGARRRGMEPAVRAAGPAMSLTTLTTAVGFGGLAASRLPALQRGGLLVAVGTLLCLAATLLVLPALAAWRRRGSGGDGRRGGRLGPV